MDAQKDTDLRRQVIESTRRELAEAEQHPAPRTVSRESRVDRLGINPELMPEVEKMGGPESYQGVDLPLDEDLLGSGGRIVMVTLERSVKSAVERNLQAQFARLAPAVSESQVIAAEAAFDWSMFGTLNYEAVDEPRPIQVIGTSVVGSNANIDNNLRNTLGLKRLLTTGGQITLQQDLDYLDNNSPGVRNFPNPADSVGLVLRFDQPLLRNFGSDVSLAQVRVTRNQELDAVADLKKTLIKTVTDTEQAYWQLVQAHRDVLILKRLLDLGIKTRDETISRRILDASPAQIADAVARVEKRIGDLRQAQNIFRSASDRLKTLINDPDMPVGSQVLVLPVDQAVDAPITFSVIDSFTQAVQNRPEVQQAILSIDNTSIRRQVADNARLPQLDLRLQLRLDGQDDDFGEAYNDVGNADYVSYLFGLNFEQPIGNRKAESQFRQRVLERTQAAIAYQNTVQQIIGEVQRALRAVVTNYTLIEQRRVARLAEANSLRAFRVEKENTRGFTVALLSEEFRRQESLAQAERDEIGALVDYSTAIAALHAATGTALERNRIQFVVPDSTAPDARNPLPPP